MDQIFIDKFIYFSEYIFITILKFRNITYECNSYPRSIYGSCLAQEVLVNSCED